eukprot:scaffold982_cov139-Cylindrotheca_fusiformis.AAC.28
MSILLETTLGDIVIDLDVEGSPELCKNVLKLAKARYYSQTLVYNVQVNRFCQLGDPHGDGSGGACIQGLISSDGSLEKVLKSNHRFLRSNMGRPLTQEECREKGRVVATEMNGIADTIGSQLLITTSEGQDMALDGYSILSKSGENDDNNSRQIFRSVGVVREDEKDVLGQIASTYCDADGRPYADVRVIRALIVDDPFEDPEGMEQIYQARGVVFEEDRVVASPEWERPPEEKVEGRIPADQIDPLTGEEDLELLRKREEEHLRKQDKSRAVVLEMVGDLPSADIKAPENVLFVCKLNPVTEDEDLELIFSRFDEKVKAEIIRDPDTGNSLHYAFIEFTKKEQAAEAYFRMNNALVDDRRIKVDFSQSVAKVWDKFNQRMKTNAGNRSNLGMPKDPFGDRDRPPQNSRNGKDNYVRNDNRRHNQGGMGSRRDYGPGRGRSYGNGGHTGSRQERRYHPRDASEPLLPHRHNAPPRDSQMNVDQFGREIRRVNNDGRNSHHHSDSFSSSSSSSHERRRRRSSSRDRKHRKRDKKRESRRDRKRSNSGKKKKKHHRRRDDGSDRSLSPLNDRYGDDDDDDGGRRGEYDRKRQSHDNDRKRHKDEGRNGHDERQRRRGGSRGSRSRDRSHRKHHSRNTRRSPSDEEEKDNRYATASRSHKSRDEPRHHRSSSGYREETGDSRKRRRHDSPDSR